MMPRGLFPLACVVLGTGCLTGSGGNFPADASARPASATPRTFLFAAPLDPARCQSPARDPRDGTSLTLVRSNAGRGDYDAPAGHYGVMPGEYLRLECGTGSVIGIVAR